MGDDNVVPFGRPAKPQPDRRLHPRARRAAPGARDLAVTQNAPHREAYAAAASQQREQRLVETGRVVPARITMALDIRGLHGHGVDRKVGTYHGNPDGDIDRWEQAIAVPSDEQLQLLATLTDFPIPWFYEPIPPGPVPGDGPVWMCWRDKRGCEAVAPSIIDERGVLLYEGKPRQPPDTCPPPLPGMPEPDDDPEPPRPRPARAKRSAPAKARTPDAEQTTLPTRMPEHLRAELDAILAARKKGSTPR